MTRTYIRTDRNGTQYFQVTHKCGKCNGTGIVDYYVPVNGGDCYDCNGTGVVEYIEKVYTEEYLAKKAKKEEAKAKAERVKELHTFYPDGVVYFLFDTCGETKKAALKANGAQYNPIHHWHAGREIEGFRSVAIPVEQAFRSMPDGTIDIHDPLEVEVTDPEAVESQHIGTVGDKLDVEVTYSHRIDYERRSFNGYGFDTHSLYFFTDTSGNVLVWDTLGSLCDKEGDFIPEGAKIRIKASVKSHKTYKETKQTMLSRVRVA